jgi:hypothetical protein
MDRLTAREFKQTFQRLDAPAAVGNGIWFPQISPELVAIAEGRRVAIIEPGSTVTYTVDEKTTAARRKILAEQEARDGVLRKMK